MYINKCSGLLVEPLVS